uniref:NADH-ubiquinone oxidoreductase chain 6 n=1 Tax=Acestrorhynchus sp. NM-2010 TaxID=909829 RepID=F7UID9_9TELE|nr:NADH dehydrogenase subunit 6 [Acestrorhynchus sp. NM-2010]BAK42003.1 NADH dehydrogenase subunit 6 [Acestrorhynchus sp. NM-2010]
MSYLLFVFLLGLVMGLVGVASNPAPYFAAFGLVVAAGVGSTILIGHGGSFLSLVLFLIYLGGMLVVFAYSAALAAEPFPESWGDRSVMGYFIVYLSAVMIVGWWLRGSWYEASWFVVDSKDFFMLRGDVNGVVLLYSMGGGLLIIGGSVLLLTLLVVLELTRGLSRGALRAV